jgi:hypothetical protein
MKKLILLLLLPVLGSMAGCGPWGASTSVCAASSVCPVIIYEKYPGVFATIPEHMTLIEGDKDMSIIWGFADPRFHFDRSDTSDRDGVFLIDKSNAQTGLMPCYGNANTKTPVQFSKFARFDRCDINDAFPAFKSVRYRITFRDDKGKRYSVDPTVDTSSGGGTFTAAAAAAPTSGTPGTAAAAAPSAASSQAVAVGDDVKISSGDVTIVWSAAGQGGLFGTQTSDSVSFFKDPGHTMSDGSIDQCYTSDQAGAVASSPTAYFSCQVSGSAPFKSYYGATYKVGAAASSASGFIQR